MTPHYELHVRFVKHGLSSNVGRCVHYEVSHLTPQYIPIELELRQHGGCGLARADENL